MSIAPKTAVNHIVGHWIKGKSKESLIQYVEERDKQLKTIPADMLFDVLGATDIDDAREIVEEKGFFNE